MSAGSGRIRVIEAGGGGVVRMMVSRNNSDFTTTIWGKVPFDTVNDDPLGMWDMANSQAVVPTGKGGLWSVGFSLGCRNNGITEITGQVYASGSGQGAAVGITWPVPVGPIVRLVSTSKVMDLVDGDVVVVDAYAEDNLNQPLHLDGSSYSTFLWMVRLGT